MRVLGIPYLTLKKIEGDSLFLIYRELAERLVEYGDTHVTLDVGAVAEIPRLDIPRVALFGTVGTAYKNSMFWVSPETKERWRGEPGGHPIHAVVVSKAASVVEVREMLERRWNIQVPVFVIEPNVLPKKAGQAHMKVSDLELLMQAVGYAFSTPLVADVEQGARAVDVARKYLSPSMARRVEKNVRVAPLWIDTEMLDAVVPVEHPKPTIVIAGRVNAIKQPEISLKFAQKVYASGRDVSVLVLTNTVGGRTMGPFERSLESNVELQKGLGREDYLPQAKGATCFVNASRTEGFSIQTVEQLYMGVPVLLPDKPWARARVGGRETYPFLYRDETEAVAMILACIDNAEWAKAEAAVARERIRGLFTKETALAEMARLVHDAGVEFEQAFPPMGTLVELLNDWPGGRITEAFDWMMKTKTHNDRALYWPNRPAGLHVHAWLIRHGFTDCLDDIEARYVR